MPAAVETAVYANEPAWHRLGTVVDTNGEKGIGVEKAIELSGLSWEVNKGACLGLGLDVTQQIQSYDDFMKKVKSGATLKWSDLEWAEDQFTTQRDSDGKILGVVGKTWEPVQNLDGFQIVQDVIEQAGGDQVWIEAAGSLDGGRIVWVLAHIDLDMQIAGEQYMSYLLFTNGHNGRRSVTAACLDIRVVCQNTLDWGLSDAEKTGRIVRVRHTTKASERIKQASHILGLRNMRAEELARQGEWLVEYSMDDGEFNNFLETLLPVSEEQEGKPAGTMVENQQDAIRAVYCHADNLNPIRGTAWGALQSVVEYSDHHRNFQSKETQLKAQWGITGSPLKQQAANLAVAFAAS